MHTPERPPDDAPSLSQALVLIARELRADHELRHTREVRWQRTKLFLIILALAVPVVAYSIGITRMLDGRSRQHVAIVEISGEISGRNERGIARIIRGMESAMRNPHAMGMILSINSPGGSPAQAERIRLRLDDLRAEFPDKEVVVAGGDMVASAAYLIASGADHVAVLPSTLTGSIGVIHQSFGLARVAEKVGVEVRTITSGSSKSSFNPFTTVTPEQTAVMKEMAQAIHVTFIEHVQRGRAQRLKDDESLFTGRVFLGHDAVKLGLADEVASIDRVIDTRFQKSAVRIYGSPDLYETLSTMRAEVSAVSSALHTLLTAPGMN